MNKTEQGLYPDGKYTVTRYDNGPVGWCFVLETKDPLAEHALKAYDEATGLGRPPGPEQYTAKRRDGKPITLYYVLDEEDSGTPTALRAYSAAATAAGYHALAEDLEERAANIFAGHAYGGPRLL